MKQSNLTPMALLICGVAGALYCAYMTVFEAETYVIAFAIASLVAVIGWHELIAAEDFNESFDSE